MTKIKSIIAITCSVVMIFSVVMVHADDAVIGTPMQPNAAGTDFVLYPAGSPSQPGRPIVDYSLGSKIGDISRGNHKDSGLGDCPIIVPRPAKSAYDPITILDTSGVRLTDIAGHWAQAVIQKFVDAGYIAGYDDGTFRPDDPITYAELATIIARMGFAPAKFGGGLTNPNPANGTTQILVFKDTANITDMNDKWYYQSLLIAGEAGFFGSKQQVPQYTKAKATDYVQRQYASLYVAGCLDTSAISTTPPTFSDMDQIDQETKGFDDYSNKLIVYPDFVADKITTMYNAGIINGYPDGTFNPTGTITRAEMVAMLQRVLDLYNGDKGAISDNLYGNYMRPYWHQEDVLLELTNQDRANNGLPALKKSANLTAAARITALDLGINGSVNGDLHDTLGLGGSASTAEQTFGLGLIGQNATIAGVSGYGAYGSYFGSPPHHATTLSKTAVWFGTGFSDNDSSNIEDMKIPTDL